MNIVLVARSLQMGGIEKNTITLADTMTEMGHNVRILLLKNVIEIRPKDDIPIDILSAERKMAFSVIGLLYIILISIPLSLIIPKSKFIWRGLYTSLFFKIWLNKIEKKYGEIDRIFIRGQGSFEYLYAISDHRIERVIVSPVSLKKPKYLDKIYKNILYSGKKIICNSTGVMESLLSTCKEYAIKPYLVRVVSNPIPIDQIKKLADEDFNKPDYKYIINVGRLVPQKNHKLLIDAYSLLNLEEHLVIVGSGSLEQSLKNQVSQLGLEHKVHFIGQVANPYTWMKHAELFVLSSTHEGFGLVLVESLVCGTPIVAVDSRGGIRDIFTEKLSKYIAMNNRHDLAKKINDSLEFPPPIHSYDLSVFESKNITNKYLGAGI